MKTVFFGFISVVFFMVMAGCGKELSVESKTPVIIPDTTYQPLEANSSWVYQDSASGITTTLMATDSDTVINNKSYTLFHASSGGQTEDEYFNITAHNYFSFGDFATALPDLEILYLDDTASPGYNWQFPAGTINGFPAQVQGTIIDTGLTVTLGSNTFTHVIHTQVDLAYNVGSGFQSPFIILDYYLAKGVGIIRIETEFTSIPLRVVTNLVSYTIQ